MAIFNGCSIQQCDQYDENAAVLCQAHKRRKARGKPMNVAVRRRAFSTDSRLEWSDSAKVMAVSHHGAHSRVSRLWGAASDFSCVECGESARDWAYDGTDPTQLLGSCGTGNEHLCWYSVYPEFYMPLCRRCHKKRDNAERIKELREFRLWKAGIFGAPANGAYGSPSNVGERPAPIALDGSP